MDYKLVHICTPLFQLSDGPLLKHLAAARWSEEPMLFSVRVLRGERVIYEGSEAFIIKHLRASTPGTQIRVYEVEVEVPLGSVLFRKGERLVFRYDTFERRSDLFIQSY